MNVYYAGNESNCPKCGKAFIVPPYNVYKERVNGTVVPFCSWKCLTAWRKEHEHAKGGNPVPVIRVRHRKGETREYATITDAAKDNGVSVYYIKSRLDTGKYDDVTKCYWKYKNKKEKKE
jgi:hypothetical protein